MNCESCQNNFFIGQTVMLLGQFICDTCGNHIELSDKASIYLGLDMATNTHQYRLQKPGLCPHCEAKLEIAKLPCGESLADILFQKNESSIPKNLNL